MKELLIYDVIGADFFDEGVRAQSVKASLDEIDDGEDLLVRINSPGGDVFEGLAIYNLLEQRSGKTRVQIDGLAASIASVIAMAGTTITMADNAMMMIHNPYTIAVGDAEEMRKTAERLDKVRDSLIRTYRTRVTPDEEQLIAWMDEETWFNADEAVEHGFADQIGGHAEAIADCNRPWIRNAPKQLREAPRKQALKQARPEFRLAARARFPVS